MCACMLWNILYTLSPVTLVPLNVIFMSLYLQLVTELLITVILT